MKKKLYIITLIIFLGFALNSSLVHMVDEAGTVASALSLIGKNWTYATSSMENYLYRYGQSIFYLPVMLFIKNPNLTYKALLVVNGIIYSFMPVLIYIILKKYLKNKNYYLIPLITLLPAPFLISMFTTADLSLIVLPWILLILFLEIQKKKDKRFLSFLIGFLTMYAYMCHSRGVIIVASSLLLVIYYKIKYKEDLVDLKYYFSALIIFFMVNKVVYGNVKENLYALGGVKNATLEKVKISDLRKIFTTVSGFTAFVKLLLGWLTVLIGITFGFGFKPFFDKKEENKKDFILRVFIKAFTIFTLIVGIVWMYRCALAFYVDGDTGRLDRMVYVRYMASIAGPLLFLALYKNKNESRHKLVFFNILILLLFYLLVYPNLKGITGGILLDNSISLLAFSFLGRDIYVYNFVESIITTCLIAFGISAIYLYKKNRDNKNFGYILCAVFLLISMLNFKLVKVDVDNIYKDQVEAPSEFIYNTKAYKKYPMVMNISQSNNIRRYQMRLSDYQLFYCNNEIEIEDNFFIITNDLSRYMGSKCLNEDGKYYKFENYNYKNKDKVYIKGDKLYKYLVNKGYKLNEEEI